MFFLPAAGCPLPAGTAGSPSAFAKATADKPRDPPYKKSTYKRRAGVSRPFVLLPTASCLLPANQKLNVTLKRMNRGLTRLVGVLHPFTRGALSVVWRYVVLYAVA